MKKVILTILFFQFFNYGLAQKVSDVLEDGINMKESQYILFDKINRKDLANNEIHYEIIPKKIGVLKDSVIFLVNGNLVKPFMKPLNPLNYSYEGISEQKPDQIDIAEADKLKSIISYVSANTSNAGRSTITDINCQEKFKKLNVLLDAIKKKLEEDKKAKIVTTFEMLKELDFLDKDDTRKEIEVAEKKLEEYKKHFKDIDSLVEGIKDSIKEYNCNTSENNFLMQGLFDKKVEELVSIKNEQFKRVKNLEIAYSSVVKIYKIASKSKECGDWCLPLKPDAKLEKGKMNIYTLSIKKSGYRLSTSVDERINRDEIIAEDSKEVVHKVFRFRKFKRFVPEVSAGIAYTNLDFPKYGALADEISGDLKVSKIGNDNIKRLNITAMLNYNYFIDQSQVHPFIQLGAGINTDFPTLFLGSGLRFSAFNGSRLAISCGFAGSWIKSLKTLKIGEVVGSDADVEKDIQYEFAKPKLYYGLQFNF